MSVLEAFLQGVLQGLTEFLPVSSSGHLSLFQYFTGNSGDTGFLFSILLHAGTLIAVFIVFRRTIADLILEAFSLLRDLFTGRFSAKNMSPSRRMLLFLLLSLLACLLTADAPAVPRPARQARPSLRGAALLLTRPELRERLVRWSSGCTLVDLAARPDFTALYMRHMVFG